MFTREQLFFPVLQLSPKQAEFTFGVHPKIHERHVKDNQATIFGVFDTLETLKLMEEGTVGTVRALLKQYEMARQWIVYGLMWRVIDLDGVSQIQFGAYERIAADTDKTLLKASLGIGGHVEQIDVIKYVVRDEITQANLNTEIIALTQTLVKSFLREAGEEVTVTHGASGPTVMPSIDALELIGFVSDSTQDFGYVGNIHAGVIGTYRMPSDAHFTMAEPDKNRAIGWFTPAELKDTIHVNDKEIVFEPWSKLVINEIDEIANILLSGHRPLAKEAL